MPDRVRNGGGDLHGNAPDNSRVALLLIDVINDLDFPENEELVRESAGLAKRILKRKQRCRDAGIPAIYVNDNRGRWRSDFTQVLNHSLRTDSLGRNMVEQLIPSADDYVVIKPKHSAFFATPLDALLEHMGVRSLILTGITTNACVIITAGDIYVRDYALFVPSDCVAGLTQSEQRKALDLMQMNFDAAIRPSGELDLDDLCEGSRKAG